MRENKPHLSFFIYHPWPKLIELKERIMGLPENLSLDTNKIKDILSENHKYGKIKKELVKYVREELNGQLGLPEEISGPLLEGFENKQLDRHNVNKVINVIKETLSENKKTTLCKRLMEEINKDDRFQNNFLDMLELYKLYKKYMKSLMENPSFWEKIEEILKNNNDWSTIKKEIKEYVENKLSDQFRVPKAISKSLLQGFEDKKISRDSAKVIECIKETLRENSMNCPRLLLFDYLNSADIYENYKNYLKNLEDILKGIPHISVKIYVYKCVVGLGEKGPFEVGMTLHPVFGIPYVPGSAVKGVFKRAFILWCKLRGKNDWGKIFPTPIYSKGTEEKKEDGLCFTGALPDPESPESSGEICLDVMCPHIKSDKEIVTEFDNPTPIQFWILKDSHMRFYVYPSKRAWNENKVTDWIKTFERFLNDLKGKEIAVVSADNYEWILTFGAKTSSGYGIFKVEGVEFQ